MTQMSANRCVLVRERKKTTCRIVNIYAGLRMDAHKAGRFESCQLESLRQHRLLSIEAFGRAVESGLSGSSGKPRAGSSPAPAAKGLGSQLASCPSSISLGRTQTVIVVQPVEHLAWTRKQQVRLLPKQNPVCISLPNGLPFRRVAGLGYR